MRWCRESSANSHSKGFCWVCGKITVAIFPDPFVSSHKCILFEQMKDLDFLGFLPSLSLALGRFGQLRRSCSVPPLSFIGCREAVNHLLSPRADQKGSKLWKHRILKVVGGSEILRRRQSELAMPFGG
jgi:hypothetical protein